MALSAERFLRDKLQSEIESFGDGEKEFHTREIQLILECLYEKDISLVNLNTENIRLVKTVNQLNNMVNKLKS